MEQGSFFIGCQPSPVSNSPQRSYPAIDDAAVIAEIARRVSNVEKQVKWAVQGDKILSQIVVSQEAILIQSDKIGMLGEVTFADWYRDVNGDPTGNIDPSITQIRGGVIRTGQVVSKNGKSWLDLDATGTTSFIRSASSADVVGVDIKANGNFSFGVGTKALTWDGSNLRVSGGALIGTTSPITADQVATGANRGNTLNVANELSAITSSSADAVIMNKSQLFRSSLSTTQGVFIGSGGIYAQNDQGDITFTLNGTSGSATFAGDLMTSGYVKAGGNNNYGISVALQQGTVAIKAAGCFENLSATGTSLNYATGVVGNVQNIFSPSNYAVGVAGISNLSATENMGVFGFGTTGVYGFGITGVTGKGKDYTNSTTVALDYGLRVLGRAAITGDLAITANTGTSATALSVNGKSTFSGDVTLNNAFILSGTMASTAFEFSSDGGTTWSAIRLRKQ